MPKMIQVRNVPDDVHRILKARAAAAGMTLSDYVKHDLESAASQPSLTEFDVRVASRGSSGLRTDFILETLRVVREP
jgi:plasmid stability protein